MTQQRREERRVLTANAEPCGGVTEVARGRLVCGMEAGERAWPESVSMGVCRLSVPKADPETRTSGIGDLLVRWLRKQEWGGGEEVRQKRKRRQFRGC